MRKWGFALSSADQALPSAPILLTGTIEQNMVTAAELGYQAIEVHMREDAVIHYDTVRRLMQDTGVQISMIISGRLNTEGKCSLIADEPYITSAAMEGMRQYIDHAQKLNASVVVGWARGNLPKSDDRGRYIERLANNLRTLSVYAAARQVKILIEVINRYEMDLFTTADEVMSFLEKYDLPNCYAHLDTFHMGIEETDPVKAIHRCGNRLADIHLADNTRRYPGSGRFDFRCILKALEEVDYKGYLSVECLPEPSGKEAAQRAIDHLRTLIG